MVSLLLIKSRVAVNFLSGSEYYQIETTDVFFRLIRSSKEDELGLLTTMTRMMMRARTRWTRV